MSSNSDFSLNFDDENFNSSISSLSNISSLNSYSIIDEPNVNSSSGLSASLAEENRAIDNYISNNQNISDNLYEPNNGTEQDEQSLVFQSSESLNREILNGDFSKSDPTADDFGWNTEGLAYVESGRGILAEGSAFLSGFDQTFTISEDARSLQFTLVDSDLGDNSFAPPDSLEIALLDADTFTPLTGTHSLGDTDAFFNLQNDGTVSFSDRVSLGGTTSGETIDLDNSHTVSVDISHLAPGTEATLYFDLLGFGAVDSIVLIDDVLLTDSSLATPIAVDDTSTLNQGETVTIDVLTNDSDPDGTIIPASLQIQTQPDNGTAILLPDGTISYLPDSGFAGGDSFTYTVQDNDGQSSNPATVDITVNNLAPKIDDIQLPDTIIEGTEITISAIASDSGNDELTYTWTIDGQTTNTQQPTISQTFVDNGIYNATLTVTDPYGGSDSQTFDIIVDNAAPTVDAGEDRTVNEGETVTLSGTYSDLGVNDTHTAQWEFDDGTIIEEPTAQRTYSEPGSYTATFTVTDNDGASTSQTINITVNNTAPTINSLTGDTNIDEGDTATFNASATDSGNGELTYTWDFGDATPQLSVESNSLPVTHTYADNGNYTVTLAVEDENGASSVQTLDITVDNVPPAIASIDGATTANEGETVTYTASVSDPGDDELTYNWTVNGEPINNESDPETIDYTFADNGNYNLSLTVTDDDGAATTSELEILVDNVAPTINIDSSITGNEGEAIAFNPIIADPGNDTLTVTLDFGDNSEPIAVNSEELPVTHTYTDNGNYTATLTVTDEDGAATNQTIDVTINNTAPVITSVTGDTEINEGEVATFNAIASDSGNDTLTYTWDFGDGTSQLSVNSNQLPVTHTYADDGDYTVTLTVTDEEGESVSSTLDVTVNNTAPAIAEITGETNISEGTEVTYTAIASDRGNDTLTYSWDFGDGNTASGQDVTHTFADNGNYTITLTVTDDDNASSTQTLDVTVNNVAPTIDEIIGETNILEGIEVSYTAIASDSGNDTLTYTWDFGDGSESIEGENVAHTFIDNGNYTVTLTVSDDDGAATTSTLDVTVNNVAPTILEIIGSTEVEEGESINYSATATDSRNDTLTYSWDFGDGSEIQQGADVTHTFTDNGNYTVALTVTDDDGAATTSTLSVVVNNVAPVITEIIGDTEVSEGEEINYLAIASDGGDDTLTYTWDFGDGSESIEGENVTHTFTDNGNYTITLTVTDDDGAATSSTLDVTVNNVAPIITEITGDTEVNEGQEVTYSAIAGDDGDDTLNYSWNFGDGSEVVEGIDVTHTFTDNGNYTVTLTVSDDDGAVTTKTKEIIVSNLAPVITEIIGETSVLEGEEISYSAIASDSGNDTLTYSWDFGDGSEIQEGADVTHTFANNGNYTIALTVTDDDGAATTSTIDVTVNNVAPTITEILGNTEVNEGEEATYSAIASDAGNDTLTYSWNFGDGSESVEGESVSHVFTDNGEYTITLTVTDSDGAATSSTIDVTVNNLAPVITEIVGDTNINEGQEVSYSAIASEPGNDTLTYSWDFGDGVTAIGESVTHTFTDNGSYTITLSVRDDDGATATQTLDVLVSNVAPIIDEIIGSTNVNEGQEVTYSAIASEPGNDTLTYNWDFGDGVTAIGENVTHTFSDDGNYTVTLTVTDDDGATATSTLDVVVNNLAPVITSFTGDSEIDEGEVASFGVTATDEGNDTLTYAWDFGDGSETVFGENVEHLFVDNGLYDVSVTVTDDDGSVATQSLTITVNNVTPVIDPWSDQENDEGEEIRFNATFSDPGRLDNHTVEWDFGDGSEIVTETINSSQLTTYNLEQTHTYTDDGIYTATLTITDSDDAVATNTMTVTVNNTAPAISNLTGDTNVLEGASASFRANATDGGNDTLTYSWDFGDGKEAMGTDVTHIFSDNGEYTVTLTVTDDDGAATASTINVTVNNVAPKIDSLNGDTNINEGEVANFNAVVSDPGSDELTYSWDFGDGSESLSVTSEQLPVTHIFSDNGNYTVTLTVIDDDGAATSSTIDVTVNNVAPTITNITYGEINEGVSTQFSADATDGGDDTLTYTWDFGDGSEPVTGRDVSHLFTDNGDYTITLTVSDEDGGSTSSQTTITAQEVFNIKAEGTVRINGSSDLDGEPLNFDDDTRIYAGKGFIINGNQTLPVQRDENGNPIQIDRKSVLIDRAVTVGPNYTQSKANASRRRYVPLIPPQVIDELSVNVPSHNELVSSQLALLESEGSTEITFNPQQNPINNVNDWNNYFPNNSNAAEPTIVRITNGNLNIPNNVSISNYVFVLDNGNINFNGSGHTLDNTALILNNGSINLASVQSRHLTVLVSGAINMNGGARFAGDTLIATGNSNGSINFNGATVNNEPSYLRVISQGNIIFNGSSTVIGEFLARKNFTANGSSSIVGSVQTKGDIRFNGSATISSLF